MNMNMKKIVIIVLVVLIIIMLFCLIKQGNSLFLQKNGFNIHGTYENKDSGEYIVFCKEDDNDENIEYYFYKQYESKKSGNATKTINNNLFNLKEESSKETYSALLEKDSIYIIKDNEVIKYDKISKGLVDINIKD